MHCGRGLVGASSRLRVHTHRRALSSIATGGSLTDVCERLGARFVLFSWCDLFGTVRSKMVPASKASPMAEDGAGFAGFAANMDMEPSEPDILATPDQSKLVLLPWNREVAFVPCDLTVSGREGPLLQSPRYALKAALAELREKHGLILKTGVELEFHLLEAFPGGKLADPTDKAAKPCYAAEPLMRQAGFIQSLLTNMEDLGWDPYQADHEDSNGQFELNWKYSEALETADRHFLYKYMVRSMAEARGMQATFMPKPFVDLTGNSCHVHISLHRESDGANVFDRDAEGTTASSTHPFGLSDVAMHFVAGILHHAPGLTAISNPTVNSFKRINAPPPSSGATWSPSTVSWTGNNRTHMVRVPDAPRFEFRLSDSAANPYLLPAAILAAGKDGIDKVGGDP